MIMPGVQNPHWRPCWSQNACWSGWSVGSLAMPSIVLRSRPSAWTASIVHDLALSPFDMDGAGAAVARIATDMRAGQPEVVAQEVDEQEAGFDVRLMRLAVDGDRDVLGAHRVRASYAYARARSVARRRALRVSSAAIARLYSTGPRTSPAGLDWARRRRPPGGTARRMGRSRPGRPRRRSRRTAHRRRPVSPIPAPSMWPSAPSRTTAATPTVAKSPTLRSSFS